MKSYQKKILWIQKCIRFHQKQIFRLFNSVNFPHFKGKELSPRAKPQPQTPQKYLNATKTVRGIYKATFCIQFSPRRFSLLCNTQNPRLSQAPPKRGKSATKRKRDGSTQKVVVLDFYFKSLCGKQSEMILPWSPFVRSSSSLTTTPHSQVAPVSAELVWV
jgi:hypothetical protein